MKRFELPPDRAALDALEAGDEVLLTGELLTMRDAALKRLEVLLAKGEKPPFDLAGAVVFHAGPSPPAAGRPAGAVGPTTSARMDRFMPMLFEHGAVATLGKGPRGEEARAAHERPGAVYFAAVGGVGALYGGLVEEIETIAWEDLGPEAVHRVVVRDLPATVAIDSRGRDFLSEQYRAFRDRQ